MSGVLNFTDFPLATEGVRNNGPQNGMWFHFVATLMLTMRNVLTKCKLYWLPTCTPQALDLAPNGNFIFYKLNNKGIILNFTGNTNSNTGTELNITEQTC